MAKSTPRPRSLYLIVVYAMLLHFIWAAALIYDSPESITAMSIMATLFSRPVMIGLLAGSSILAGFGIWSTATAAYLLMLPQQFLLFISAGAATKAMILGSFADGTVRSHWFLIADQAPAVLIATLHFVAFLQKLISDDLERYGIHLTVPRDQRDG